jgi:solute:Na+ symporter, SSS family
MTNLVISLIFVAVVGAIAFFIGRDLNYEGYWLNNRRTSLLLLVATIVATQVGAGTTLGIAASTAAAGTGYGLVAVVTTSAGFLLIPLFIGRVIKTSEASGEFTLTGLYRWRFGRLTGLVSAVIVLLGYLAFMAGQLVAAAALVEALTPLRWGEAIAVSSAVVLIYAAFAGLKGDFITDGFLLVFKTILLVITAYVLWSALGARPDLLASIPPDIWSPTRFGGYTYLVGGLLIGALIPIVSLEMWLRVFATNDPRVAKSAFRWSALLIVPFYLAPMAVGAVAASLMPIAPGSQTVLVDFLAAFLSPSLMAVVYVGLIATIISSSNTLELVLGAVVHRDLLPQRKESVALSRLTSLLVGLVAAGAAYFVRDIVNLVLGGFFYIILLGPLFLELVLAARTKPAADKASDRMTAGAVIAGAAITTIGFAYLGVAAVILGFIAVGLTLLVSRGWREAQQRSGDSR